MSSSARSQCPINLTLEILGDRWSLLVIRDMMFGGRRHFLDIKTHSMEGIAPNTLSDRLNRLVEQGLLSKHPDPSHKQKSIYSFTEMAIQLVPVFAQIGAWGRKHLPASRELSVRAQLLEEGGPKLWDEFMDELREVHLGIKRPRRKQSVLAKLQAAYEAAVSSAT
ncbi:MAG: helix-turn-helix transcriptional regulator [Gallionella sp.]|nr:helix-turn-helix transcriptional regulator [Gallionella sp.]